MPFIPYFRGRVHGRLHLENTDFCKPPSKPFRNTFHTHCILVDQCNDRLDREWKYILLSECSFQVLNEMTGGALGGFHRWLPLKSPLLLLSVPPPFFEWSSVRNISWFLKLFMITPFEGSVVCLSCFFSRPVWVVPSLKKVSSFSPQALLVWLLDLCIWLYLLDIVLNPVVMEMRMCQKSKSWEMVKNAVLLICDRPEASAPDRDNLIFQVGATFFV